MASGDPTVRCVFLAASRIYSMEALVGSPKAEDFPIDPWRKK